jgi:dTMP kinase
MPGLAKGLLIAIDGIDGAGKTTQCNMLAQWLNSEGYKAIVIKEPSEKGKYSEQIKIRKQHHRISNFLESPETELYLFVEDRKENVEKRIKPNLEKKRIVIMDRYYFSTIAYQSVLGIDKRRILKMNEDFAPIPDLTIIIDVPPVIGVKRINGRGDSCDSFEKKEYLEKVREVFLQMKGYPNLFFIEGNNLRDSEQVFQEIKTLTEEALKKKLKTEREIIVCQ